MKEYYVKFPIAGSLMVYVEAGSEEDAINKARNIAGEVEIMQPGKTIERNEVCSVIKHVHGVELEEWDIYDKLFEGNVSHVWHTETEVGGM